MKTVYLKIEGFTWTRVENMVGRKGKKGCSINKKKSTIIYNWSLITDKYIYIYIYIYIIYIYI